MGKSNHDFIKQINIGTLLFFIMALFQIPSIVWVFRSLLIGWFGISSIRSIAIFVITILFAISLSSLKNKKMAKIYALILFLLHAVGFIMSFPNYIQAFDISMIFRMLVTLTTILCYLFIFLFFNKTNGEDKSRINNLFILSLVGMILVVLLSASRGIISILSFGNLSVFFSFVIFCCYSLKDFRVPVSKAKGALNKIVATIIIVAILIGVLALFGVFDTRTAVEKWDDNYYGALEGYMEFHGMIR